MDIIKAAKKGNIVKVKELYPIYKNRNIVIYIALDYAILKNRTNIIKFLTKKINPYYVRISYILQQLSRLNYNKLIKFIIKKMDINKTHHAYIALEHLSGTGYYSTVLKLLKKGYNPYTTNALYRAIKGKHYKLIKLLLKYGADPNISNSKRCCTTPMELAQSDASAMSVIYNFNFIKKGIPVFMHKNFTKINENIIRETLFYV
jgi:ankyrin repeat protein